MRTIRLSLAPLPNAAKVTADLAGKVAYKARNSSTTRLNSSGTSSYGRCPTPSKKCTRQSLNSCDNCSADAGSTARSQVPHSKSVGKSRSLGNSVLSSSKSRFHVRRIFVLWTAAPLTRKGCEYPAMASESIRRGSPYIRSNIHRFSKRNSGEKYGKEYATTLLPKNAALRLPKSDHGLTGAARTNFRKRPGAIDAAIIATAPPYEEAITSQRSIFTASRKPRRYCAFTRREQSTPTGISEPPDPGMSTRYTVAWVSNLDTTCRQENECPRRPCSNTRGRPEPRDSKCIRPPWTVRNLPESLDRFSLISNEVGTTDHSYIVGISLRDSPSPRLSACHQLNQWLTKIHRHLPKNIELRQQVLIYSEKSL